MRLSKASLAQIDRTKTKVEIPNYDVDTVSIGSVNIGPGNFHLGHQALLTHQLLQQGDADAFSWGICGVSLNSPDRRDALKAQDGLFTVVEQPGFEDNLTVVGSVREMLYAPEKPHAVIDMMSRPEVKLVTLTMTENGYYLDSKGDLRLDHPDIQHDLKASEPKTALGYIAWAAQQRYESGAGPFTILSCDNIQHNGDYTKKAVLTFIKHWNPTLLDAVEHIMSFPNSMVDRIVPKTTKELKNSVWELTGVDDQLPVPAETMPSKAWVIEDDFIAGRPNWEKVGAQFVPDVTPYEVMKLRLLNASHLAVACLGDLAGYSYIDETMANPTFKKYMLELMNNETGPTVPNVPGVNLPAYKQELVDRFANPAIKDTTQRVATDAPLNTALASIRDCLKLGIDFDLLALTVAAWIKRTTGGQDEAGREIEVRHPLKDTLRAKGLEGGADPRPVLAINELFGDLGTNPKVVEAVAGHLKNLYEAGVVKSMETALGISGVSAKLAAARHGGDRFASTPRPEF